MRCRSGVLYIYVVIIATIFAVGFFAFLFATILEQVQTAINPQLINVSRWASSDHAYTFEAAAWFVNNLWVALIAFVIFGLGYWGYTEAQRRKD